MARKFIINNNEIICGNADYHYELHGQSLDKSNTIGGGLWHWDQKKDIVYFYGSSLDFGKVTKEQFEAALPNSLLSCHWDNSTFVFSSHEMISDVLEETDNEVINPLKENPYGT